MTVFITIVLSFIYCTFFMSLYSPFSGSSIIEEKMCKSEQDKASMLRMIKQDRYMAIFFITAFSIIISICFYGKGIEATSSWIFTLSWIGTLIYMIVIQWREKELFE